VLAPDSRLIWVLSRAPFASRQARLRGFWHSMVRRYRYELCMHCGRPVGPHTGSWWLAPDELWLRVIGDPTGVVCPPCFTHAADEIGVRVRWDAVQEHR
jgi:hypothetical protein